MYINLEDKTPLLAEHSKPSTSRKTKYIIGALAATAIVGLSIDAFSSPSTTTTNLSQNDDDDDIFVVQLAAEPNYNGMSVVQPSVAFQSSDYQDKPEVSGASKAIDDTTGKTCAWTGNSANSVTSTQQQKDPWWNADLITETKVGAVSVSTRAGINLVNYDIRVGNDPQPFRNPSCAGVLTGA